MNNVLSAKKPKRYKISVTCWVMLVPGGLLFCSNADGSAFQFVPAHLDEARDFVKDLGEYYEGR